MKTYTAIVVDDENNSIRLLKTSLEQLYPNIQVTSTCNNWQDALKALREQTFDILFLDITMPEKGGMDILKLVPEVHGQIIFITAYQEFAIEAFNFQATGYILKPFNDLELSLAINRAINNIEKTGAHNSVEAISNIIGIPNVNGIDYITVKDITYVTADNKCTKVILRDRLMYSSYQLGKFKEILTTHGFLDVHRSYIINPDSIKRYISKTATIIMSNGDEIPLSKGYKEKFLSLFAIINNRLS